MSEEEKQVMGRHFAYVNLLNDKGKIVLGGAAIDGAIGILVFRAESTAEAKVIFDNDPAVKSGIGYPELHQFRIGIPEDQ